MNYFGLLSVNQFSYRQLLEEKVFPVMKQTLWLAKFNWTVWQEDDAKPHQARMVMKWLDTDFQDRMVAIKCLRGGGVPGPPTDLTATHLISFFWGNWKRKCTTIYPANIKMWLLWRGKLELSLARSQKWWYSSPSWTWRRGWPSWLGWKASIFRPEGKLWRHKAMKYAIH